MSFPRGIPGAYGAPMGGLPGVPIGSEFGRWCKRRLDELDIRHRAFADAVGIKSSGTVSKIINGTAPIPPPIGEDLERWADVLQIPRSERERFRLMAYCGHLPESVRPAMEAMMDEHLKLKDDYSDLLRQVRRVAER